MLTCGTGQKQSLASGPFFPIERRFKKVALLSPHSGGSGSPHLVLSGVSQQGAG